MMKPKSFCYPNWHDWHNAIVKQIDLAASVGVNSEALVQEDIHRFRSSLKFARALLRLAPPSIATNAKRLRRALGDVARQLARIRDHFVFLETLNSLSKSDCAPPSTVLSDASVDALINAQSRVAEFRCQLDGLSNPAESSKNLLKARAVCQGRVRKCLPKDWQTASASEIHSYRSALVTEVCQATFFHALTGRPKKSKLNRLNQRRRQLGEFNDLDRFLALSKTKRFAFLIQADKSVIQRARERQSALRRKLEH